MKLNSHFEVTALELAKLEKDVTPGKWEWSDGTFISPERKSVPCHYIHEPGGCVVAIFGDEEKTRKIAELIASMRNFLAAGMGE